MSIVELNLNEVSCVSGGKYKKQRPVLNSSTTTDDVNWGLDVVKMVMSCAFIYIGSAFIGANKLNITTNDGGERQGFVISSSVRLNVAIGFIVVGWNLLGGVLYKLAKAVL